MVYLCIQFVLMSLKQFNPDKQHTIKHSISISGTGLHTGILVDMVLHPANPGFGIQFKRIDLPGQPIIKADCDLVTDTSIVPDLKATLESLKVTTANTQALSKEFAGITHKLNSKDNSLGMLLNDPEFAKSLKKTIANADSASYNLNKGMEALEYTWPFNKGFKRKAKIEGGN